MYTERFNKFFDRLMVLEGGWNNDKDDCGGETKYGISKNAFPDVIISDLTIDQAKEIYYIHYYLKCRIEEVKDERLAWQIFDMGVNAGIGTSGMIIQALVDCKPDGIIGSKTITKINDYLFKEFKEARRLYYTQIVKKNSVQSKFLNGWLGRIERYE